MKKLLFISLICLSFLANAQADFADTAIENPNVDLSVANRLTLTANIVSKHEGNNASHGVQIIILLPEAKIYSYSAKTETGQSLTCSLMKYTALGITHPAGYIICKGGSIQRNTATVPNRVVKIKVVTGIPDPDVVGNNPTNFGITTYNLIPDNDMKNNFWTWR